MSIAVRVLFTYVVFLREPVYNRAFIGSCLEESEFGEIHQHIEVGSFLRVRCTADRKAYMALIGNIYYLAEIICEYAVLNSLVHTIEDIVNAHLVVLAEEYAYLIVGF